MSSSEYELRRLEDKVADVHKKLEENERAVKRNDERERWELDRLKREFDTRKRGYAHKKEALTKDLKDILTQRERVQTRLNEEREEELRDKLTKQSRNFNHRIH
jgi:hypothetical protein